MGISNIAEAEAQDREIKIHIDFNIQITTFN